jgi:hypothetical protein
MAKHVDPALKAQILSEIKNGTKVAEASAKHGISTHTIYAWTQASAERGEASVLELARLRRENDDLKMLVGLLTLEKKRGEKKRKGS